MPIAELAREHDASSNRPSSRGPDDAVSGIDTLQMQVSLEDVKSMGLDTWSATDAQFVSELAHAHFGRADDVIVVSGIGPVEICGVRIC